MEISIIEFVTYGLIAYAGMLVLIISVIKEVPTTRSLAIIRAIFLMPSVIASGILASSGVNIDFSSVNTNNLIRSVNTTQVWTETTTQTNTVILQNPVWIKFHFMLFIVLIVYIIIQILFIFTKFDDSATKDKD